MGFTFVDFWLKFVYIYVIVLRLLNSVIPVSLLCVYKIFYATVRREVYILCLAC
jgi:hypothetical protein